MATSNMEFTKVEGTELCNEVVKVHKRPNVLLNYALPIQDVKFLHMLTSLLSQASARHVQKKTTTVL